MALPWKTLDSFTTDDETLELRQRGEKDFLITLGSQILMNSMAQRSEMALGTLGCKGLENHPAPRVLVGGLGMGCTLRAVLDALPHTAEVVVAELNPRIVTWCRGPLASLTDGALSDPRVTVFVGDVSRFIADTAGGDSAEKFDAIIIDLYRGPHPKTDKTNDPFYGSRAITHAHKALRSNGIFAVWGETYDEAFATRMTKGGFATTCERPGKGGYRHAVFMGKKAK